MSTKGILSFREPEYGHRLSSFPQQTFDFPSIAPLWADFLFQSSGSVYVRETNDRDTLDQAADMLINLNSKLSDYQPRLALVITWFEARLDGVQSTYNVCTLLHVM